MSQMMKHKNTWVDARRSAVARRAVRLSFVLVNVRVDWHLRTGWFDRRGAVRSRLRG